MPLDSRSRPASPPADATRVPELEAPAPEAPAPEAPAPEAPAPEAPAPEAPAPADGAGRLARWLPRLHGLVRFAYRTAWVSAASAAVLWWAVASETVLELGGSAWVPAVGFLLLLLVPAGAAWLLGLTLHDVLTLPEALRRSASAAKVASREAVRRTGTEEERPRGGRLFGIVAALWAVRGFVMDSRGAWAKAATAARLVRLARLPFALGLVALFLLNGVVILAGIVALVILVV